jgi:hypothetical protein
VQAIILINIPLSWKDAHLVRGVRDKKIIGTVEPSLMFSGGNNRRHMVMDFAHKIVCLNGGNGEARQRGGPGGLQGAGAR